MTTLKIIIVFISLGTHTELTFDYPSYNSCVGAGIYKAKALKEQVFYDQEKIDVQYICEK